MGWIVRGSASETTVVEPPVGLAAWHGPTEPMARAHRHDDVELNLSPHGPITYELGGHLVTVPAGHLVAFWGAVPHRLVDCPPGQELSWATVPVAVLGHASTELLRRLLGPTPLVAIDPTPPAEGMARLWRWHVDLASGEPERRAIVALEMEAMLRRLALQDPADRGPATPADGRPPDLALHMARYLLEHHTGPVSVADVAAAVAVHPHHAMHLFRSAMGTTIGRYLTQLRIATAQRLLLTTSEPVARIAVAAGFGSQSQFYARFRAACGMPPAAYRATRGAGG